MYSQLLNLFWVLTSYGPTVPLPELVQNFACNGSLPKDASPGMRVHVARPQGQQTTGAAILALSARCIVMASSRIGWRTWQTGKTQSRRENGLAKPL